MQIDGLVVLPLPGARAEGDRTPVEDFAKLLGLFSFCPVQLFSTSSQTFSLTKWSSEFHNTTFVKANVLFYEKFPMNNQCVATIPGNARCVVNHLGYRPSNWRKTTHTSKVTSVEVSEWWACARLPRSLSGPAQFCTAQQPLLFAALPLWNQRCFQPVLTAPHRHADALFHLTVLHN